MSLIRNLSLNLKNIPGWRTKRKIVVFSVDDYGNVRIDSRKAIEGMEKQGLKLNGRFDRLDTLETRQDLEALFEVLTSVKDINGRHAVFTPFAMPCNIDFELMADTGYKEYHYELLPQTFEKLEEKQPQAYKGVWDLIQEGIHSGIYIPQFHGREHLNLKIFREKLARQEPELLTALKYRSYPALGESGYKTISQMAAFDFWDVEENEEFHEIIRDGLNRFEQVYGFRAVNFTPPVYRSHPELNKTLRENGISYMDTALLQKVHLGKGKNVQRFNYTGKRVDNITLLVRNVVFEPSDNPGIDWVQHTLKQIEAAFRWKKPAIISSHRVNFCGHIDKENRKEGLGALRKLLKEITIRWPDVEFMAANELGGLVTEHET